MSLTAEQTNHVLQWNAVLESDDYKQIKGKLKKENGYCCLGIACEISGLTKFERRKFTTGFETDYVLQDNRGQFIANVDRSTLPKIIREWLGTDVYLERRLATMNDGYHTFKDIAEH